MYNRRDTSEKCISFLENTRICIHDSELVDRDLDHPLTVSYQCQGKLGDLVCPVNSRNSHNTANGCHDDSGYCSIDLGTKLSYISSSSSSRSSNGTCFSPIASSCDDAMPYSVVNIVPESLPVLHLSAAINQPRPRQLLPLLPPLHHYATTGKTQL